jgi:hypothetical protein
LPDILLYFVIAPLLPAGALYLCWDPLWLPRHVITYWRSAASPYGPVSYCLGYIQETNPNLVQIYSVLLTLCMFYPRWLSPPVKMHYIVLADLRKLHVMQQNYVMSRLAYHETCTHCKYLFEHVLFLVRLYSLGSCGCLTEIFLFEAPSQLILHIWVDNIHTLSSMMFNVKYHLLQKKE